MTTVPNTNGIDLTSLDLYAIAVNAGFKTEANGNNPLGMPDAVIATALAMAENGNRTSGIASNVLNPVAPDYSIGPWQINLRVGQGGTIVNSRGGFTAEQLTNPFNNVVVAKILHDASGGWNDWSTFTGGQVWNNLGPASMAAASLSLPDGQMEKQLASINDRLNAAHAVLPGTQGGSGPGAGGNYPGTPLPGSGGTIPAKIDLNGSIVVIAAIVFIVVGALAWKGGDLIRVAGPSTRVQVGPRTHIGVLT